MAWQDWLTPPRPGLRQFVLAATGLALPLPAVLLGADKVLPAMAVGVVIGVGLGLGWAILFLVPWTRRAPVATFGVFAVAFACLLHVWWMPRWELLLRAQQARGDLIAYRFLLISGLRPPPPQYRRGWDNAVIALARGADARGGEVMAYTPRPLQRWTPLGWRDGAWLVLRGDGEVETLRDAERLAEALARREANAP